MIVTDGLFLEPGWIPWFHTSNREESSTPAAAGCNNYITGNGSLPLSFLYGRGSTEWAEESKEDKTMWRTKLGHMQVIQRSWLTKNHGLTAKNQPLPLQMPVPKIHCLRNLRIQHKVSAHHWCRTMFLTKADTCITRLTHPTKSIREKTLELSK